MTLTASEIYKKNNNAILKIVAYDKYDNEKSHGTAVVLKSIGAIVTNYHNVFMSSQFKLFNEEYKIIDNEIIAMNPDKDILILALDDVEDYPDIDVCNKFEVGDDIFTISYQSDSGNTITRGIISGTDRVITIYNSTLGAYRTNLIQFDASISSGSSGGGLFNTKGQLIGITTLTNESGQNLNFAINIKDVIKLYEDSQNIYFKNIKLKNEVLKFHHTFIGGDYQKALTHINKCIKLSKNTIHFIRIKIKLLLDLNRVLEANKLCEKKLKQKYDEEISFHYLNTLIREEKNKEALRVSLMLFKKNPKDYDYCCTVGLRYLFLSQYKRAIVYFNKAKKLNRNGVDHLTGLAKAYILQDQFFNAGLILHRTRKNHPNDYYSIYLLSELYYQAKKYSKSLEYIEEYIQMVNQNMPVDIEIDLNKDTYYKSGYEEYMGLVVRVDILSALNQFDRAQLELNELLESNPQESELYVIKARIMNMLGNTTDALKNLNAAIKINPNNLHAYERLSKIQLQINQPKKALNSIERNLKILPNNIHYLILKANICFKLKRLKLAIELCKKILRINKSELETLDMLRTYYYENSNLKLAMDYAKRQLAIKPCNWMYLLNISKILFKLDKLEEALPFIDKAILWNPTDETYLFRAKIHFNLRNLRAAIFDCDKAEKLNDTIADIYYIRGKSLNSLELFSLSIPDLEKAMLLKPKHEKELRPLLKVARKK